MGAPQYEQAGADIGGSGTTNTIPRWTGASTLGDSGLIDNGTAIYTTARNFGIGTASPGALLDVNTGAAAGSYVTSTRLSQTGTAANSGQRILFYNSAQAWEQGAVGSLREGANNNFSLTFFTSSAGTNGERARIDSAGNFGLGTTPSAATLPTFQSPVLMLTGNTETDLQANAYYAGAWKYVGTGVSTRYAQSGGNHLFYTAVSGTAGNNISYSNIVNFTSTAIDASIVAGYGLKLPATPGNTDPNTLDAYVDGGTAAAGGASFTATLKGSTTDPTTPVTTTGKYVLVGKVLTMSIYFDNVNTTGASGDVIIETNLAAALRPQMRSVGQVGIYNFNAVGLGTFADARTDGKIYIMCNQNNNVWTAATHSAGAGRYLLVTVTFIIG